MAIYTLERTQRVPGTMEEVWAFFSNPGNLQKITPPSMGFEVTSRVPETMYPGLVITYKVSPFGGFKLGWMTEITHVQEPSYFVDEQRHGPYAIWHHEHHFTAGQGYVDMVDRVTYKLPFGLLGRLVHPWLVRPRLEQIFDFRIKAVEERFGKA